MSEFKFKQFTITQNKTAMKVSTDGVLLGSWIESKNPKKILDVGSGTGLIAIMAAQKFINAKITAVEIDYESFIEAQININNCPWTDRIKILNENFIDFASTNNTKFDLIISNPPFFENQLRSPNSKKNIAKHTDSLSFFKLISSVEKIISKSGLFSVIIPNSETKNFVHLCIQNNLFLTRSTEILPNENKKANRILLEFSKKASKIINDSISIRKNNTYTKEYLKLTKDYYLFAE